MQSTYRNPVNKYAGQTDICVEEMLCVCGIFTENRCALL